MIAVYQTTRMEETARLLCAKFKRVIVNAAFVRNTPTIRFRAKSIADLKPIMAYALQKGEASHRIWDKTGGLLLTYRRDFPELKHDAQIVVECPLSIGELEKLTAACSRMAVLYRPPTWKPHEDSLKTFYPSLATIKQMFEVIAHAAKFKPEARWLSLIKALGLSYTDAVVMISENDLCDRTAIPKYALKRVRLTLLKGRRDAAFREIQELVARVEPIDKALMPHYNAIKALPAVGTSRAMIRGQINRVPLRELIRCGSVERKAHFGYYVIDQINPDFKKIADEHAAAQARWKKMMELIESAPQFTASALVESRRGQAVSESRV